MKTIIVGSKNAAKVAAVQQGIGTYWPKANVRGEDVVRGISSQPLGHDETIQGALNRARAAAKAYEGRQNQTQKTFEAPPEGQGSKTLLTVPI